MRGDYGTSQDKLVKTTNGRTLKSGKAPGEDEVCAEMLKAGGEETARHLCQILQNMKGDRATTGSLENRPQ